MQTTITEFWWIFSMSTVVFLTLAIGFISVTIYSQKRFIASQEEKFKILQESEERFRLLVKQSPVPTLVIEKSVIVYVNDAVLGLLKSERANDILGKSLLSFVDDYSKPFAEQRVAEFIAKNKPLPVTELKLKRFDEKSIETEVSAIPIMYSGNPAALVVISDVTQAKQAEEVLREVPRKIIEAQESERRRFARELHDGVNQVLFNVKGSIEILERKVIPVLNNGITNLSHIIEPLKDAMKEIQRVSRNLRPSSLDDFGLGAAVRSMAEDFSSRTHIRSHTSGFPQYRLMPELELAVFRIVQEALNNIEKHSMATDIIIECVENESSLFITVSDDGVGINLERLSGHLNSAGVGLTTMKERAKLVGGSLTIGSAKVKGTQILVQVPKTLPVSEQTLV